MQMLFAATLVVAPGLEPWGEARAVTLYLTDERRAKVQRYLERSCMGGAVGGPSAMALWGATSLARYFEIGQDSALMQHSSNFFFGLTGMALIHGCLSSWRPERRREFLLLALGANAGLNVAEEVNLGDRPLMTSQGNSNRTSTDWGDLVAGLSSQALYVIAAAGLGVGQQPSYRRFCAGH